MPYCTGGTQVKSGAPSNFWLNRATWESIFPDSMDWLAPFLTMAAPDRLYETALFCALEPPAPVAFDISEIPRHIADIVSIGPFALKMQQWAEARLWDTYCECLSNEIAEGEIIMDETYGPYAPTPGRHVFGSFKTFPPGTTMSIASVMRVGGSTYETNATFVGTPLTNWWNRTIPAEGFVDTPKPVDYVFPDWEKVYYGLRTIGAPGSMRVVIRGHQPNTAVYVPPSSPAAPAELPVYEYPACDEEDLCARLNDLDSRLQIINGYVQLVQRQTVPFAYLPGEVFPARSGSGTLAVQGILALSVNFTAIPSAKGQRGANPVEWYDVGYLSLGTADGFQTRHILRHDPHLITGIDGFVTVIGYSFPPGVVATITTFEREP